MEQLIERYIYDVTRRLPEREREEVRLELMSSISDMLPENPDGQAVAAVLTELGAPSKLAEKYRQEPRYLISPRMYDLYLSVLKKVTVVMGIVFMCVAVIDEVLSTRVSSENGFIIDIISHMISGGVEGALQGAFWVTLGFAIADRSVNAREWSLKNLPKLPGSAARGRTGNQMSRAGIITSIALTVLFTSLLVLAIRFNLPVFVFVSKGVEIISPFSQAAIDRSIPFIIIIAAISMAVSCFKLFQARWSWMICAAVAAQNVIMAAILSYIVYWEDLISAEFTEFAKNHLTGTRDILNPTNAIWLPRILAVIFIIFAALGIAGAIKNTFAQEKIKGD
ncbi:MAG: hypothetical protein LBS19_15420 [Clostridiales bacterium]|jgi:hypothetical protein|nr:hypothetical protein [Clostridiales bacterium]